MRRAALHMQFVLQMMVNRATSFKDTTFNIWKSWAQRGKYIRNKFDIWKRQAHLAGKKKSNEFFKNAINNGITRINKILITRTMVGWRGEASRARSARRDTSQKTTTADDTSSPTQLDPKDTKQRTSSKSRRKANKLTRKHIRAAETPDRQSTWEHKRKRWEARQQEAILDESKPRKKYAATMPVIQDQTPKASFEQLQTHYYAGIIFAQTTTPLQSPPRKGRYKIIQRGLWKQPRKIFQRKAQKGETRSSSNP
jgi:hypothetical protein